MYTFTSLFLLYIILIKAYLRDWFKGIYLGIASFADSIGLESLALTIDIMGHKVVHGTGVMVTAAILSVLTMGLMSQKTINDLERNAQDTLRYM